MKKQTTILVALLLWCCGTVLAQVTFPYNGVKDQRDGWYAFTNATVIPQAGSEIKNATLVIKEGRIVSITPNGSVPEGAVEVDAEGKYIYPSLIDMYAEYGLPEAKSVGERPRQQPQMLSNKEGAYGWNEALKPEFRAHEYFTPDGKAAKNLRGFGFGVVSSLQQDGISRGSSVVVSLGEERANEVIIKSEGAHYLSFSKGVSTQSYPNSLMGVMALLRQTYIDAAWYQDTDEEGTNLSLEAWNDVQALPQIFAVSDWQEVLRAQVLAKEFGKKYIIKGSGDEYQRIAEMKQSGATFILPLDFPDAYDVTDPYDAHQLSLTQLRHWEMAPTNPAKMAEAGIKFAITADGHKKSSDFFGALRKAIESGLSEADALRALTETPATLLGISEEAGTLATGKWANFLITSAPLFAKGTKIHHNWVQGKPHVMDALPAHDLTGDYTLKAGSRAYNMTVGAKGAKIKIDEETELDVKYSEDGGLITLSFPQDKGAGLMRLSGLVDGDMWRGRGQDPTGAWINWEAEKTGGQAAAEEKEGKETAATAMVSQQTAPYGAFGWTSRPQAETVIIRNATLWTNEESGILEKADIMLQNGKIAQVGGSIRGPRGAIEIDGEGMHVTPGIIDEHSHIAISRGVNESSQESTAEVSIADVVDATDVDIYRQLSGGVTTSQLLHGSANPIGGQSALIKLRWGYTPEEMKFAGAPGFIKFALGENVKQSNRSNSYGIRYPQTRMGVEQVFENYFTEARAYGEAIDRGEKVRRDLELETLLEILNGERFITCHSYQQGEINMLLKVADRFGFRVNTFTHILEGYKVADKMAEHGAGGSSFSDWWAYKFEVVDAIPYNGAIMHEQGVTVAFNSDDAEMARRLNQEAAKAVLFGGVSEEEALKFVTLNPAKLLHIDDKVGSLKVGKDADIVIWTDNPLSVYARAKHTYVDGIKFYDMDEDVTRRAALQDERNALIQKMLDAKEGGAKTQPAKGRGQRHYHCDTEDDEGR
ncbi:amidohydrolase family protein [Lewinella cohaerens]|uniref:amidohydrolase family protein n=1 Tax=Lewinella cohaerens TaxID=70995 RepID=UPI0003661465|nr:amidohydrolase family protein [Lewinella cohaerens]